MKYLDSLIDINKNEVLRYLEYKGQHIDESLNNTIDECIKITKEKIDPRYILRVYPISKSYQNNNYITYIEGTNLNINSEDIYRHLHECNQCAILAVTLGINIEKEINKNSYLNLTKSIILDSCATTAIESISDLIQNQLEEKIRKENKYITSRYSPGYGDFPLYFNGKIIEILNTHREIGLTITEKDIMIPRKSIIAIIGISNNKIINRIDKCSLCSSYNICKYKKGDEGNECKRFHTT